MSEYFVDLGIENYKILQDADGYAFTQDSVFLANMVKIGSGDRVLDLGSGCGILSILAVIKRGAAHATGIELQGSQCALAKKSAAINGIGDKLTFIEGDVRDVRKLITAESFDKVLCNPPYFTDAANSKTSRAISRSETCADLNDFIAAAAYALRFGGDAGFVIKAMRLATLLSLMTTHNLTPKRMTLIYPKLSRGVDVAVVTARKGGKEGLEISTFIAKDEDGGDTREYREIFGINASPAP